MEDDKKIKIDWKALGLLDILRTTRPATISNNSPEYNRGFSAGSKGQVPPEGFRRSGASTSYEIRRTKQPIYRFLPTDGLTNKRFDELTFPVGKLKVEGSTDLREGYLEGLHTFVKRRKIQVARKVDSGIVIHQLRRDEGLDDFLRGMQREAPVQTEIVNYIPISFDDYIPNLNKGRQDKRLKLPPLSPKQRHTYTLGFMVSVARDFDVVLQAEEVPETLTAYSAFANGSEGNSLVYNGRKEFGNLLTSLAKSREKEYGFTSFISELKTPEERCYEAGLKVWLAGQKLDQKYAAQLANTDYLEGFKDAIEGRPIKESLRSQREPVFEYRIQPEESTYLNQELTSNSFLTEICFGSQIDTNPINTLQYRLGHMSGKEAVHTRDQAKP